MPLNDSDKVLGSGKGQHSAKEEELFLVPRTHCRVFQIYVWEMSGSVLRHILDDVLNTKSITLGHAPSQVAYECFMMTQWHY
jgi:hypothetical protein